MRNTPKDNHKMKPKQGFFIKNCCLGHYRARIQDTDYCMLIDLVDCSKKHSRADKRGLYRCKTQLKCEDCTSYSDWTASGMPAEEWIEIRGYNISVMPASNL